MTLQSHQSPTPQASTKATSQAADAQLFHHPVGIEHFEFSEPCEHIKFDQWVNKSNFKKVFMHCAENK